MDFVDIYHFRFHVKNVYKIESCLRAHYYSCVYILIGKSFFVSVQSEKELHTSEGESGVK